MKTFKYNNITPRTRTTTNKVDARFNPFNVDDSQYMSLGDKIKLATEQGADIGARINPQFDDKNCDDLDITCSMRHDPMDIAEEFGKMPNDVSAPIQKTDVVDN